MGSLSLKQILGFGIIAILGIFSIGVLAILIIQNIPAGGSVAGWDLDQLTVDRILPLILIVGLIYLAGVVLVGAIRVALSAGKTSEYVAWPFLIFLGVVGSLVLFVGPQLAGEIIIKIREGFQNFVNCKLGNLSGSQCNIDSGAILQNMAFAIFAVIAIVAAWKVKIIAGAWAIAGTALILPLAFFYALGALPEDYKTAIEEVVGATPLVTTPLEQQAAADKAAAELKAAEAKRLARLAELERQRVAALEPEWSLCTLPEFSKFTSCFRVTVKRGGPPFRITKASPNNKIVRDNTAGARFEKSGLTFAYYHDDPNTSETTFHVFEMEPGQVYRTANIEIRA